MNTDSQAFLQRGIDGFNRWRIEAMGDIDKAIEAAPDNTLAHTLKGIILFGGRNRRFIPVITECLLSAEENSAGSGDREQHLVLALRAMVANRLDEAVLIFENMLEADPVDLLVHRLVQQELFWMGEARWMRDIAARARPAWTEQHPDFGGFLSVYAFSHEEAGDYQAAERAGREAVERDPGDVWGTHAVAHVLEMQGRFSEGITWLQDLCGNWQHANQIRHHLWWHLCLYLLEAGHFEQILELLDNEVRNPESPLVQAVPDAYIDIQNVASMLMRLELRGIDVGSRWHSVAEAAAQRIGNHPSPFTSAHAAMILAATGATDKAAALIESLRESAADQNNSLAPRIRVSALPAAQAALAHRRGDFAEVIRVLMPARRNLWQMGGSHAQRDIFIQLLADACHRLQHADYLRLIDRDLDASGFSEIGKRSFYGDILPRARARSVTRESV